MKACTIEFEARSVKEVTTGRTGLCHPSGQGDVALLSLYVSSSCTLLLGACQDSWLVLFATYCRHKESWPDMFLPFSIALRLKVPENVPPYFRGFLHLIHGGLGGHVFPMRSFRFIMRCTRRLRNRGPVPPFSKSFLLDYNSVLILKVVLRSS